VTTRVVSTFDGSEWRLRRRWLPHREGVGVRSRFATRRRQRAKRREEPHEPAGQRWYDFLDLGHGCADDDLGAVVALAVVLGLMALIVAFGGPVLLLGIDLAWFIVVLLLGAFSRFVLRRPWSVEAVADDGTRREWKVKGYRDAGRLRDALAGEFSRGLDPRPDDPLLSR
jgi:hypothetical protein